MCGLRAFVYVIKGRGPKGEGPRGVMQGILRLDGMGLWSFLSDEVVSC